MKILIKAQAGSHLFGTNSPSSDKDYKGVYLPTAEQILLGTYPLSVQHTTGDSESKNSKDDIDVELYSFKKFLKMVSNGDTAALELLFTPEDMIIEKDPIWDEILEVRDKLLSSKVSAMIGYARQQANKYGIKGSRMGELSKVIEVLKTAEKATEGPKMKHNWEYLQEELKHYEHVHFMTLSAKAEGGPEVPAIDILGKKFDYHCRFDYVLQILTTMYRNFGQRAREAKKNGGIDWKALSHAVRVSIQGIELLEHGKITLPLKESDKNLVKSIKYGKLDYSGVVQPMLETFLDVLEKNKDNSKLPEKVDEEFIKELTIKYHRRVLND